MFTRPLQFWILMIKKKMGKDNSIRRETLTRQEISEEEVR